MKLLLSLAIALAVAKASVDVSAEFAALQSNAPLTGEMPFTSCGEGSIKVEHLFVSPDPPQSGKDITVRMKGQALEDVLGGKYSVTVSYAGLKLMTKSDDICTLTNFSCPFKAGAMSSSMVMSIPSYAPAGTYDVQTKLSDTDDVTLTCVSASVKISKPSDVASAHDMNIISKVNSNAHSTWTAGVSKRFFGSSLEDVKGLCGVLAGGPELPEKTFHAKFMESLEIPDAFDSRNEWGTTCPSLHIVRDQGACGSCWAVAAAAAITDRTCIQSNGTNQLFLSAQDLTSCCGFTCGMGCNGGYPAGAWGYWKRAGLVTGGLYDSEQGCYPYQIPSCEHHSTGSLPACGDSVRTPSCSKTCTNGADWVGDKHKGSKSYSISSRVADIQAEIMQNGPVEAAFTVYADFPSYKSGVYQHVTGGQLGGHAVKIVGWGEQDGTPFWTVANSWNEDWGDKGFFKILRGNDECGIEASIVAGDA